MGGGRKLFTICFTWFVIFHNLLDLFSIIEIDILFFTDLGNWSAVAFENLAWHV